MLTVLHFIFCILTCLCGLFVSFSNNAISSVVFLILVFCNASILLFMFNVDFLGLIFIIIYVGAVAVLFLFIIMMLPIKRKEKNLKFFSLVVISLFILIFFFLVNYSDSIFNSNFIYTYSYFFFDNLTNINSLGQVLFNYFIPCFLIAGIILLIALIGSIVLTLKFEYAKKSQISFRQLSRSNDFLSFFKI
jgi:NADH-quinone oxidoreductase subunit J